MVIRKRRGSEQPKPISDAELEVLKVLWQSPGATVRDVLEHLATEGRDLAYTTVQTLLQRLENKKYVVTEKETTPHVFRAATSRDELIRHQLGRVADRVCDGKLSPLVLNLVRNEKLSGADIRKLRSLLDELEAGRKPR